MSSVKACCPGAAAASATASVAATAAEGAVPAAEDVENGTWDLAACVSALADAELGAAVTDRAEV